MMFTKFVRVRAKAVIMLLIIVLSMLTTTGLGDVDAQQADNIITITFDQYPVGTFITDQYLAYGIVFGGDSPFITNDGSNPTSPVLSGTPQFQGSISATFVHPDDGTTPITIEQFELDAGYFNNIGSTQIEWFDINGNSLGIVTNTEIGIEHFVIVDVSGIGSFTISPVGADDGGYAIDNVTLVPVAVDPPSNDDFSNPKIVTSIPYTDNIKTISAMSAGDDPSPSCGYAIGKTVWYSYTPTENQDVRLETLGSDFDTVLSVWTGTRGSLVEVGCNDNRISSTQSRLNLSLTAGTSYYIMIGGNWSDWGNLEFNVYSTNDNFASPIVIPSLPYQDLMDTTNATDAGDDPTPSCATVGKTVWYSYTPSQNEVVLFNSSSSWFNTVLSVWTGPQGSLVEQGCGQSQVEVLLTNGTTYYIMAAGLNGESGDLSLYASLVSIPPPPPDNDDFDNAKLIDSLSYSDNLDDTFPATEALDDPVPSCGTNVANTIWYRYDATYDTTVHFDTTYYQTNYDTVLSVWTGARGALSEVACSDDYSFTQSSLDISVSARTSYYVMLGGDNGAYGSVRFYAEIPPPPPPNDDFDNATVISPVPFSDFMSWEIMEGATDASDDPIPSCGINVSKTVWYSYTSTNNGAIIVDTYGSAFDTTLAVYTGLRGSLTEVGCNDDGVNAQSELEFATSAGTTYYIMVGGNWGGWDDLAINAVSGTSTNTPPIATDDSAITDEDVPIAIDVLLNDTDVDGDSLSVIGTSTPSNGSVVVDLDNTITYTPNANFHGVDSFTYDISDGNGGSDTAKVNLAVNSINDAPILASIGNQSLAEGDTLELNLSASDIDSLSLSFSLNPEAPAFVSLIDNNNGTATLTIAPSLMDAGIYEASISVSDGDLSDSETISITVGDVNQTPTADDQNLLTDEDVALNITLTGSDPDGDTLSFNVLSNPMNGVLSGTIPTLTYTPNADFNGNDSLTFEVCDPAPLCDTGSISITVKLVNDAPVAVPDTYEVRNDQALIVDVPGILSNDTDIDGDTLSATMVNTTTNGSLTLNTDGSFTYTPNTDFVGSDTFTYTAFDGVVESNITTVTINVLNANIAPVAVGEAYITNAGDRLTVSSPGVLANDTDENGDSLSSILVTDVSNGRLNLHQNGSLQYTPDSGFSGVDSFTYMASDAVLNSNVVTVVINVASANYTPQNINLLLNPNFDDGFKNWEETDAQIRGVHNEVTIYSTQRNATAIIYQLVPDDIPAGSPIEAHVDLSNTSSETRLVELRITSTSTYDSISCNVLIPPNTPAQTLTVRGVTDTEYSGILFEVVAYAPDVVLVTIDNTGLYWRPNEAYTATECLGF